MKNLRESKIIVFIIDEIIKKRILIYLPDKLFVLLNYYTLRKTLPNIRNPITFSEKIQWIKLYGGLEKYTEYVDKYEIRDFIRKTIGEKYLIPLVGMWGKSDEINFNKLPRQFVLKATHGQGYNYICKDKSSLDIAMVRNTLTNWINEDFYKKTREIQYKFCKPKILCEKYLEDESGSLIDYKIFCFNGKPHIIEVISDRYSEMKDDFMDLHWRKLPFIYNGYPQSIKILKKPPKLDEMIDIASKLSKPFPFVRVDLYSVNNSIYFGELTFTPANGLETFDPPEVDYQLGKLIDLSKYR